MGKFRELRCKTLRAALAILLALVLSGQAAGAQKNLYCEGKGSTSIDNNAQSSTMKAWMKGFDKFRMVESGKDRTVITIVNGPDVWVLSAKLKKGVHRIRTPQEIKSTAGRRALGNDILGFRKEGAKPIRTESVGGEVCDYYEIKKPDRTHKLWVLKGPDQLTKKRVSAATATFSARKGEPAKRHAISRQVEYNWKFDAPMPDSLFTAPSGYKVEESKAAPPGSTGRR